jgi:hypothetical protein
MAMSVMNTLQALNPPCQAALRELVDAYRVRCLWSFRPDFYPQTEGEAERVLDAIQRYGDREGFIRSAEIRTWLSPSSNAPSASS